MRNLAGEVTDPWTARRSCDVSSGRRLRTLRETAGKTTSDVSVVASRSKLWRIEEGGRRSAWATRASSRGSTAPTRTTVDAIGLLAQGTRTKGWWEDYRAVVPDWFGLYIGLESSCNVLQPTTPS
jgi:hypothetical protein